MKDKYKICPKCGLNTCHTVIQIETDDEPAYMFDNCQCGYQKNIYDQVNEYENKVGYRNSLCNKIYYNPQLIYPRPVYADGTEYPQQNFKSAMYDGFLTNAISVDLSTEFMAWRSAAL